MHWSRNNNFVWTDYLKRSLQFHHHQQETFVPSSHGWRNRIEPNVHRCLRPDCFPGRHSGAVLLSVQICTPMGHQGWSRTKSALFACKSGRFAANRACQPFPECAKLRSTVWTHALSVYCKSSLRNGHKRVKIAYVAVISSTKVKTRCSKWPAWYRKMLSNKLCWPFYICKKFALLTNNLVVPSIHFPFPYIYVSGLMGAIHAWMDIFDCHYSNKKSPPPPSHQLFDSLSDSVNR